MKPCSVLGSGASTLLRQLLCRLLPRCHGPRDHSASPTPTSNELKGSFPGPALPLAALLWS